MARAVAKPGGAPGGGDFCVAAIDGLRRGAFVWRFCAGLMRERIMMADQRLFRSVLYVPASHERAMQKARSLSADAIIFDLEDAVAPEQKAAARIALARVLEAGGFGARTCLVRVNGLDTPWGADDLAAFGRGAIDGILLPKVDGCADLDAVTPGPPVWAMIETARGVLNVAGIAGHERIVGLVMGTNDLAQELGARPHADREPLLVSLQMALLAARASGRICIDGVFNAFKDDEGLQRECVQGRDMGFDGKTLIHPAQIGVANAVFAPDADEVDLARRQIAAFEDAMRDGKAVAVVDGRIVENLHIATARATLAKIRLIEAMEG